MPDPDWYVPGPTELDLEALKDQLKKIKDTKARKFREEQAVIECERVRKEIISLGETPCR